MPGWDDELAWMDAGIDAEFGETFAHVPMMEIVNGNPVPDESRAATAAFTAIYAGPGRKQEAGRTDRITSSPTIAVSLAKLPAGGLQRFDRVTRAKTGIVFEVTAVIPDDEGRVVATLVEVKA